MNEDDLRQRISRASHFTAPRKDSGRVLGAVLVYVMRSPFFSHMQISTERVLQGNLHGDMVYNLLTSLGIPSEEIPTSYYGGKPFPAPECEGLYKLGAAGFMSYNPDRQSSDRWTTFSVFSDRTSHEYPNHPFSQIHIDHIRRYLPLEVKLNLERFEHGR